MRFCPQCGEERLRPDDLSLRDLLAQLLKNATRIDGKLLRSWRTLLTSPGSLTAAHVRGERRRTMNPLTLFFIANALFVAMHSLTGVDVLSSPLSSHLHTQDGMALHDRSFTSGWSNGRSRSRPTRRCSTAWLCSTPRP